MWNNFFDALQIMGKGMLGIFAAIVIIMIAVMIMGKLSGNKPKEDEKKEQ